MNQTLLIIDDSKAIRTQVMQIFADGKLFAKTLQAEDGITGFKLLVNNHVDIILCDIEMPGIDGLKFLAMLQSREDLRDKPVIMLTSHKDLSTKVRGLESGGPATISLNRLNLRKWSPDCVFTCRSKPYRTSCAAVISYYLNWPRLTP